MDPLTGQGKVYKDDQPISDVTYKIEQKLGEGNMTGTLQVISGQGDLTSVIGELKLDLETKGKAVFVVTAGTPATGNYDIEVKKLSL
jgi:hypothetical protein